VPIITIINLYFGSIKRRRHITRHIAWLILITVQYSNSIRGLDRPLLRFQIIKQSECEGGKVIRPTHRHIYTSSPGKNSWYSILLLLCRPQSHRAAGQPRRTPLIRIGNKNLKLFRNISTATFLLKGVCTLREAQVHRFEQQQACAKRSVGMWFCVRSSAHLQI
jgi:hypothetical protein